MARAHEAGLAVPLVPSAATQRRARFLELRRSQSSGGGDLWLLLYVDGGTPASVASAAHSRATLEGHVTTVRGYPGLSSQNHGVTLLSWTEAGRFFIVTSTTPSSAGATAGDLVPGGS